jgi:ABC-type siderophore export system fused ATPase/permease subunit
MILRIKRYYQDLKLVQKVELYMTGSIANNKLSSGNQKETINVLSTSQQSITVKRTTAENCE